MTERHCAVVREVLLDEHMAVEAAHFRDGEYADGTEGVGRYVQHFALCNVCAQLGVGRALETEERDVARGNVAFERALRNLNRQGARHDLLVLHGAERQLLGAGVAAVEAHEDILLRVRGLVLDVTVVEVCRDGVVDVEQRDGIEADAGADELGKRAVDVHFAGNRDAHAGEAAVDIARNKAELRLECRPALACNGDILAVAAVLLYPVEQGDLILCELRQNLGLHVALAELFFHVFDDLRDTRVALVLIERLKEVELGVFFNLNAEVVKRLNGRVAGEEVQRARAEADDLEALQADDRSCNRHELVNHVRALVSGADRVFRNVNLYIAQLQVVAGVQHAAICVAAAVHEVFCGFFRGRTEHNGAVKVLCKQRLGNFRTEVAKVNDKRVAACVLYVFKRLYHVDLALHDTYGALINFGSTELLCVSVDQCLSAVDRKGFREAVTADGNNADLDLGNVVHKVIPPVNKRVCMCFVPKKRRKRFVCTTHTRLL